MLGCWGGLAEGTAPAPKVPSLPLEAQVRGPLQWRGKCSTECTYSGPRGRGGEAASHCSILTGVWSEHVSALINAYLSKEGE